MERVSWSDFKRRLFDEKGLVFDSTDQFIWDIGANSPTDWQRVPKWEERDDAELLSLFTNVPKDDLVVISEVCYFRRKEDPILVVMSYPLPKFASDYFETFGECLFNGDLFILSFASNYVGIFHHEGAYYEGELAHK